MSKTKAKNTRLAPDLKGLDGSEPRRFAGLRRLFDPSRSGAILLVLVMVGVYLAVRLTVPSGPGHAQLRFVEGPLSQTSYSASGTQASYRDPFSGPVYDSAVRLREAGSLGLAVSLSVAARHFSGGAAPSTQQEVVREIVARKLVPPGIEVEGGLFRSSVSDLRFTYRSEPLSFEVVALPKDRSGSAVLLRFPLPTGEANSIMYFESQVPVQLPAPLNTTEQITAAGWKIRHWRGDAMPLNETVIRDLREHDEWLRTQNQGR
jgi:hypothetical protein